MDDCEISAPALECRGIICDGNSSVNISNTNFHDCQNAAVWVTNKSVGSISGSTIKDCGGYGSIYSTFGAKVEVRDT